MLLENSLLISSGTDKLVTLYEAATGNPIAKTSCGEITTAMCLSTNLKHLITASVEGVIYVWRLPEWLSRALQKEKGEQLKKEKIEAEAIRECDLE